MAADELWPGSVFTPEQQGVLQDVSSVLVRNGIAAFYTSRLRGALENQRDILSKAPSATAVKNWSPVVRWLEEAEGAEMPLVVRRLDRGSNSAVFTILKVDVRTGEAFNSKGGEGTHTEWAIASQSRDGTIKPIGVGEGWDALDVTALEALPGLVDRQRSVGIDIQTENE